MDLSIVVPAYEESHKIAGDIKDAADFLAAHNLSGEIIVVDDGSKDNTTDIAENVKVPSNVQVKVVRYQPHRGKGYAVRKGIEQTKGQYIMFADSGCCVPYNDTLRGMELLKSDSCDIAHGSRKMQGCRPEFIPPHLL